MLLRGVPFDPDMLLEPDWREKLVPKFALMPELQQSRLGLKKLEGLQLADTLYLPERVELSGDTVILARQVIFGGNNIVIKGPHDLHVFVVEPLAVATDVSESRLDGTFQMVKKARFSSSQSFRSPSGPNHFAAPKSVTSGKTSVQS